MERVAGSSTSVTTGRSTWPSSCRTTSSAPCRRSSRWRRCSSASLRTSRTTGRRSCSSTREGWPSASPTSWLSRLGDDSVQAHHGSLSMDRRLRVGGASSCRRASSVVATASLELGIDVGPVELVCQLGSPRSIATFLQRVGRAKHHVGGRAGRPPLPADARRACRVHGAARLGPVRRSRRRHAAGRPAGRSRTAAGGRVRGVGNRRLQRGGAAGAGPRAAHYSGLGAEDFEEVVELVSEGVVTGRGRRGAQLHRDRVNGVLRPRRGARLTASTSAAARSPTSADYRVVLEPEETLVGTVNEDWAIESMAGDVFLLGSAHWRIRRVEPGTVRVVDAEGASPTVPFWLGEAPARTAELSEAVSDLRRAVATSLDGEGGTAACRRARRRACRGRPTPSPSRSSPTWQPPTPSSARCRRRTASSSSASSTTRAACSSSSTPPRGRESTAGWGWRSGSVSAGPSTSSCRRRRATMRSSSRSVPSTRFPWRRCSATCPRRR